MCHDCMSSVVPGLILGKGCIKNPGEILDIIIIKSTKTESCEILN